MRKNLRYLLLTLLCAVVTSAWSADTWVKTAPTALVTGDIVAIVDLTSARAMANNNGTSNAPTATAVTLNSAKTEITSAVGETLQWVVTVGDDGYQFGVGNDYLYCTNTNNGVRVGSNENNKFTFEESGENGYKYLINTATSRYIGVYIENNNPKDWRCYTSVNANIKNTQTAFFKKVTTQGAVNPSDNITISGTTMEVGETVTITKPGDLSVTYSTSDGDVATVSEGVVTGVGEGTATITVSWAAVTDKYTSGSKTFTVTVTPAIARVKFVKLSSANMIAANRDFILVAENNNVAMGTQDNTNYRTPVEVTINNNAISIEESELTNYAVLNLSSANGGWKIKASDGKYLKASGSKNELYAVEENEAGIWTITGDFQLQSGDYYIQYNSGSSNSAPRFSCYKNTQKQAVLYIKDGYEPISTLQASAEISSTELTVGGSTATITTAPADLVVTYSSSDENVATVSEGVVTAVAAGTATITVSWDEQTIGEDTYASGIQTFTINVTSNQPTTSKTYQKVTSTTDLTTGNYLIVYEEGSVAFDGSLGTLDVASNTQEVTILNNEITTDKDIFFTIDMDAKSIKSASGYYIGVTSYSNGLKSRTNEPYTHTDISINNDGDAVISFTFDSGNMSLRYNKASDQNRFRYFRTGQQPIQLYKEVTEEPESVTITISADATDGKDCFATLSALGEGYFTVPADLEVSTLIVNESGKFEYPKNFAKGDAIPGDGAYLLRGAAGEYTFTPTSTPAEPVELGLNMLMSTGEGNITVSAPEGEQESDYYFYKLALNSKRTPGSVGFYWGVAGGGTFLYGKAKQCYLAVPQTYVKLGTSAILFDETNGIENVTTENRNNETYTLTGVRISGDRLPSGIYIVNGKKQVVR